MKKCILCERPIKENSPFSNYCSSICERKGIGYGEEKGKKKGLGCFATIIIIIVGFVAYSIRESSSEKKQTSNENQIKRVDIQNSTNRIKKEKDISEEIIISEKDTFSQSILNEEDLENADLVEQNEQTKSAEVEKAIEMLKQDKSIKEIANSTTLNKKEIRQLKRKLRNEE